MNLFNFHFLRFSFIPSPMPPTKHSVKALICDEMKVLIIWEEKLNPRIWHFKRENLKHLQSTNIMYNRLLLLTCHNHRLIRARCESIKTPKCDFQYKSDDFRLITIGYLYETLQWQTCTTNVASHSTKATSSYDMTFTSQNMSASDKTS